MPASSSSHPPPRSNRPSHHNSTTHAAFTNAVRNTLDAPLPPLRSPDSSSSSSPNPSLSPASSRFRNSGPLVGRSNALRRPTTPNGWHGDVYGAPLTPPSPSGLGISGNSSSGSTTLVDGDMLAATELLTTTESRRVRRHDYQPTRAFANAEESPATYPNVDDDNNDDGAIARWRDAPGKSVLAAAVASSGSGVAKPRPSQSAQRGYYMTTKAHQAPPPISSSRHDDVLPDPHTSLPRYTEELYIDLGIIAALPSLEPRDHLASLEAMNDTLALWATANPVAGMHVVALVRQWRVATRFEGTLALDGAGEWMRRRRLSCGGGSKTAEGGSFAQRMRRRSEVVAEAFLRDGNAKRGFEVGRKRGERKWEDIPLMLVLLYSDICDVDVTRLPDRKVKEMLAEWAGRYWPVSDENLVNVMMEWGSETKGKVDLDPRKWRREDEGKVGRVIEKIRGLGVEEVRRGDSLIERLSIGRERRRGSVMTAKR